LSVASSKVLRWRTTSARSTPTREPGNDPKPAVSTRTAPPVIASSRTAASATVRAIGPASSWVATSGTMPAPGTSPWVGFMPTTPLNDAGDRREPEVSVPIPATARPAATATAVPLLDPPGEKSGPWGLTVWPPTALTPGVLDTAPASSERLFVPRTTAPAARTAATTAASSSATWSASENVPAVVCSGGAVAMLSFTVRGMPSSGPREAPAARRSSDARASSRASGLSSMMLRSWSSSARMRDR
jgi:hypothetical protein